MPESFAQVAPDAGGKRIRTRERTIGSNLIEEQYVLAVAHDRVLTTRYWFHTGNLTVAAAADSSNVGRVYIQNDAASTVLIAVTFARFKSQLNSALATPTSPRITLRTFTYSGTASGTAITGAKQDTSLPSKNSLWNVRSAATGMTIAEVADIASFYPIAGATAVGYTAACADEWRPEPDRPLILRAGEGVMVKQADTATASDTRLFSLSFEIEEFTQP